MTERNLDRPQVQIHDAPEASHNRDDRGDAVVPHFLGSINDTINKSIQAELGRCGLEKLAPCQRLNQ
ncbi:hypothetical protein Tco_1060766, partial [Tanacetum coccineum]